MTIDNREGFLTFSVSFLFAMLLITMVLAEIAGVRPIAAMSFQVRDLGIGIIAAAGMMLAFGFIAPVRRQAQTIMGPLLILCRWYDLIVLAILVGIIEELLFRGVLEPWAAKIDPVFAFFAVNILFGSLHAVTIQYAILAGLLGGILSLLAHGPGEHNLLRPIVAHAVYDYLGFLWITAAFRREHPNFLEELREQQREREERQQEEMDDEP